jgi:hypothetical protein
MQQSTIKITVSQTPSQNQIKHWWRLRNKTKQYIKKLENYDFLLKNKKATGKMHVKITRFSTRTLDYGNLVGGCKPLLDAMKQNGLIVDDSPKWIEDEYFQENCKTGFERTEIEIKEVKNG